MLYKYKGICNYDSICDIERVGNIIVVTELEENTGTSITNMAESLATKVCNSLRIDPDKLIWIEHYPESFGLRKPYSVVSFDYVQGKFHNPKWKDITTKEFYDIIASQG